MSNYKFLKKDPHLWNSYFCRECRSIKSEVLRILRSSVPSGSPLAYTVVV